MPEIKQPEPLPAPEPLPTPQQAPPPPPMAPMPIPQAAPAAPAPPPMPVSQGTTPPPQQVTSQSAEDQPIVKRKKSKRAELQQASGGTKALRIPLDKKIGSTAKGSTGSTGLNIPS